MVKNGCCIRNLEQPVIESATMTVHSSDHSFRRLAMNCRVAATLGLVAVGVVHKLAEHLRACPYMFL